MCKLGCLLKNFNGQLYLDMSDTPIYPHTVGTLEHDDGLNESELVFRQNETTPHMLLLSGSFFMTMSEDTRFDGEVIRSYIQ